MEVIDLNGYYVVNIWERMIFSSWSIKMNWECLVQGHRVLNYLFEVLRTYSEQLTENYFH